MPENWKEIADYSWPLLLLILLFWGVYLAIKGLWSFFCTKVWEKLFNEETGLMTTWFSDQHKLVAGLQVALSNIPTTLATIDARLDDLGESYSSMGGRNSEVLESLVKMQGIDVDGSRDVIRKVNLMIRAKILVTNAETALIRGEKERAIELQDKARELLEQASQDE